VLRLYEAALYNAIPRKKEILFPTYGQRLFLAQGKDASEAWRNGINALIKEHNLNHPEAAKSLLEVLFPEQAFKAHERADSNEIRKLQIQARVSHPAFFDRYFQLSVSINDVAEADVIALKNLLGNPVGFGKKLSELQQKGLTNMALEKLLAYSDQFNPAHVGSFLEAYSGFEKDFAQKLEAEILEQLGRTCGFLFDSFFSHEVNSNARYEAIKTVIHRDGAIYIPTLLVSRAGSLSEPRRGNQGLSGQGNQQNQSSEAEELQELRSHCLNCLMQPDNLGRLQVHPLLRKILIMWSKMANKGEVKRFSVKLFQDDPSTSIFLERILCDQIGKTLGPHKNVFAEMSKYIDLESLSKKVSRLNRDHISPRGISLVDLFNRLYEEYKRINPSQDSDKNPPKDPGEKTTGHDFGIHA
jgi:hypothetical protein